MPKPGKVGFCALLFVAAATSGAERYAQFPGPSIDDSTLRFKQKVESIYASGNFERALLIYRKELAPQGDKYAQYMTGYMYLHGQGVPANPAAALAWYRLAAERGEPKFIEARDALRDTLDAATRARADELFVTLWQAHGDRRILLELIEEDLEILKASRLDRVAGTEAAAGLASGYSTRAANPYYERVRSQLAERIAWLDAMDDPPGVDSKRLDALEAGLRRELESLGLR